MRFQGLRKVDREMSTAGVWTLPRRPPGPLLVLTFPNPSRCAVLGNGSPSPRHVLVTLSSPRGRGSSPRGQCIWKEEPGGREGIWGKTGPFSGSISTQGSQHLSFSFFFALFYFVFLFLSYFFFKTCSFQRGERGQL